MMQDKNGSAGVAWSRHKLLRMQIVIDCNAPAIYPNDSATAGFFRIAQPHFRYSRIETEKERREKCTSGQGRERESKRTNLMCNVSKRKGLKIKNIHPSSTNTLTRAAVQFRIDNFLICLSSSCRCPHTRLLSLGVLVRGGLQQQ